MKYRHELKYYISRSDLEVLKAKLSLFLTPDKHQGKDGYCISSLYFDTFYNKYYDENESGIDIRKKIRIRTYDHNFDSIRLEIKSKNNSLCHKESQFISFNDYLRLRNFPFDMTISNGNDVLSKVEILNAINAIKPVVIVEYDRYALVSDIGNVRITFDQNIRATSEVNNFDKSYSTTPILSSGIHILEVKYDDILPNTIANVLDQFKLNQCAFSKYYMTRDFLKL